MLPSASAASAKKGASNPPTLLSADPTTGADVKPTPIATSFKPIAKARVSGHASAAIEKMASEAPVAPAPCPSLARRRRAVVLSARYPSLPAPATAEAEAESCVAIRAPSRGARAKSTVVAACTARLALSRGYRPYRCEASAASGEPMSMASGKAATRRASRIATEANDGWSSSRASGSSGSARPMSMLEMSETEQRSTSTGA
jgi:hypothetical protein